MLKVVPKKMEVSSIGEMMESADISKGKALYETYCTSCHGMSGKGDGPAAVSLRPKPKNLTDAAYMSSLNDQYLYDVIAKGGAAVGKSPFMPGWGTTLSDEDIADIISYIRSLSE
jgi:mono/diheme cytochrome c family protein